jgi:hypothetical protein
LPGRGEVRALNPPFATLLEAIEFAESVLQVHGAAARDYEKGNGGAPCYNITDGFADALTVSSIVRGVESDRCRMIVEYLAPHAKHGPMEFSEVQVEQLKKTITLMTHQLCSHQLLVPCRNVRWCGRRKKNVHR